MISTYFYNWYTVKKQRKLSKIVTFKVVREKEEGSFGTKSLATKGGGVELKKSQYYESNNRIKPDADENIRLIPFLLKAIQSNSIPSVFFSPISIYLDCPNQQYSSKKIMMITNSFRQFLHRPGKKEKIIQKYVMLMRLWSVL